VHETFHEPGHADRQLAAPGRGIGVGQYLVLMDKTANDRVVAQPAARLRLPGLERLQATLADHPGLMGQRRLLAQDQVGQGAAAQVGGTDALPAVAAGQRDAGGVMAEHVRSELARHAEVAAPGVGNPHVFNCGNSSPNR